MTTTTRKWSGTRGALERAEQAKAAQKQAPAAAPEATPEPTATAPETEAARLLADLEERVKSGDETVTPEEVEHARGLSRFATLRQEAARRRAETEAEQEAEHRRTAALTEAERILAEHPKEAVDARVRDVQQAMAALRAELDAYHASTLAAWDVLSTDRPVPPIPYRPGERLRHEGLGWGWVHGLRALYRDGWNILTLDVAGIIRRATTQPPEEG
jgi:hypothetical protein